jgi:hypothetical protein
MPDLFERAVEAETANLAANTATAVLPNGSY